jgi:hypothetical protein
MSDHTRSARYRTADRTQRIAQLVAKHSHELAVRAVLRTAARTDAQSALHVGFASVAPSRGECGPLCSSAHGAHAGHAATSAGVQRVRLIIT